MSCEKQKEEQGNQMQKEGKPAFSASAQIFKPDIKPQAIYFQTINPQNLEK